MELNILERDLKMLPVFCIVKESWSFLLNRTKDMPLLLANYLLSSALLIYFLTFSDMAKQLPETSHFLAITVMIFAVLFQMILLMPITASISRTILLGEEIDQTYLVRLFRKREWKMVGNYALSFLIIIGVSLLLGVVAGFLSYMAMQFFQQSVVGHVIAIILGILVFIVLFFLAFRLALILPLSAIDQPHPIKTSWKMMKGAVLSLLGLLMLTGLPLVVIFVVYLAFLVAGYMTHSVFLNLMGLIIWQYFALVLTISIAKAAKKLQEKNL